MLAFLYADLLVLPLLDVYRRYFGWRMAAFMAGLFFVTMAVSALVMDLAFSALGLVPSHDTDVRVQLTHFALNYTFWLDLAFGALALYLFWLNSRHPMIPRSPCQWTGRHRPTITEARRRMGMPEQVPIRGSCHDVGRHGVRRGDSEPSIGGATGGCHSRRLPDPRSCRTSGLAPFRLLASTDCILVGTAPLHAGSTGPSERRTPWTCGRHYAGYNRLLVSVTVCEPGTERCTRIDDVMVDTGSTGLRLEASAVPDWLRLPPFSRT